MKRFFIVLLVLVVAIFAVWQFVFKKGNKGPQGPKPQPLAISQHSEAFNESVTKMIDAYYRMTEAFVTWDTAGVDTTSVALKKAVDSLKLDEMKKDTLVFPTVQSQWEMVKTELNGLISDPSLQEKKASLNMLSQLIFDLLRIVKYDVAKVYYQECPMALNNYEVSAYWLSKEGEDEMRRNPYLGLKDPKYGKGMLKCGDTRDSINYVAQDTTKQK
jgi:hypothetical protein